MPNRATTAAIPSDAAERIDRLIAAAMACVAVERPKALAERWLGRGKPAGLSEYEALIRTVDATLLSSDWMLSVPSGSGSTAFDRLARTGRHEPADAACLAALSRARFRLLVLEDGAEFPDVMARDALSGVRLRLVVAELEGLEAGTAMFCRVVMFDDVSGTVAGAVTPLDQAAYAVARDHSAAGAAGVSGNQSWAEAVYIHVVRHGTLEVPGLNRPADDEHPDLSDDESQDPVFLLARRWIACAGAEPDAALLEDTRQSADLQTTLGALAGCALARADRQPAPAAALERMLLVLMETMQRRERIGSGTVTLDAVAREIDAAIADGELAGMAPLFAGLRLRLSSTARRPDDPELERLMQRIQGLRAKTVAHGCTEQEALAAAEKVAELLDRHGLSLGEMDFKAQKCEGIGIQTDRRRLAPIDDCIPAVGAFFDCRVWVEQAKGRPLRYVFFGLRGDVAAAQYLYEMVERAFQTETDAFKAGDLYAGMAGDRRSASNSFQIGLARGICRKLDTLREARAAAGRSSGRDLVPIKSGMVDAELAELGLNLTQRAASAGRRVLSDAFAHGEAAGERFEFAPAIGQAA